MTLTAHALTTWATIAPELGLSAGDTTRQAIVERMINAVSAAMESAALGRHFEFKAGIIEYVKGFGGPRIILDRTPVKSIASIQLVATDGTVLTTYDPSSYSIENADTGFVYNAGPWDFSNGFVGPIGWPWTARPGDDIRGSPMPGTERAALRVIYDGGWYTAQNAASLGVTSEVPADLEEACILGVTDVWRRRGGNREIQSETVFGSSQVTYRLPDLSDGILPAEVLAVARVYARIL